MRYVLYAFIGMGLIIPNIAIARPVSYPGGWTFMTMNDGDKNSAHIHYSPTAKTSVGYKFEYWRDKEFTLNAVRIAADWENRRFFTSYENRYTEAGEIDDFYQQSARVGFAPYEGDYGDLHTWLMLQVEHMPEADNNFTVTPLVRLFKDVHLFEAGMNNRGEVLFNYVLRY